ncbi:DNA methyltransferase [Neokomagataea thailandica NBRC 106555]|uniref:Methyltransferase n=2 Tax=Neokomagataea TaxID=1223423 RepID=A0A4Y6V4Y0_9PROT|nr:MULTISPECIES: site-specific DNA-methyltransferase [Neokomagataea]QDH25162.1 site-specific DNA-methyltransferase [Neokomagataea tanensis]GBR51955.1 DNA methyltransferase [Neokomagataea thailandica NBRC 106555]
MIRSRREKLGEHTLIRGDCTTVLRRMPAQSVDVIVTSPPYNLGIEYRSYQDRLPEECYLEWMEEVCASLKRVLKDGGSFFLNMSGSSSQPWLPFELLVRLRKLFVLQNHITWIKSVSVGEKTHGHFKPLNSHRFVNRNHEHVFHLTKTGDVPVSRLAAGVPFTDKSNINRRRHAVDRRCRGDTWFIPYETVRSQKEKFSHPGTFPVALPEACLRLHGAVEGDVLLDPFMGVGTSLIAAERQGLNGIGIDMDTRYVNRARKRLRTFLDHGSIDDTIAELSEEDHV